MLSLLEDKEVLALYEAKLKHSRVPIIYDVGHLSSLLGYEETLLYAISNAPHKFYRKFSIPKKSGGLREINEPLPTLKEIQLWIKDNVLSSIKVSKVSRAYKKNNSIKGNARLHLGRDLILKIDVKDFFQSLRKDKVFFLFYNLGYTSQVASVLAGLCTLGEGLPQGAPTSPALSNVLMKDFDEKILSYCKELNIRVSRYADDINISGGFNIKQVIKDVGLLLSEQGLDINQEKTRVMRRGGRQVVTGIIVNEKLQCSREYRRDFRQNVYYIRKWGLEGHIRNRSIQKRTFLSIC